MVQHNKAIKMADRNEIGHFEPGNKIRLRYQTAGALQLAIDGYFDKVEAAGQLATYSGLAAHLGVRRESLYRMRGHGSDYAEVVEMATGKIEADYEQRLISGKGGNTIGLIFALKQWGWSDKQEVTMDQRTVQLTGFTLVDPNQPEDGR